MDFVYAVATGKDFDKAVISVIKSAERNGWGLFNVYDVKERLEAKGFSKEPLKIVEICQAKYASAMLDKTKLASLFMPCRINIFKENNKVIIASLAPSALAPMLQGITSEDLITIETDIKKIIDEAAI